MLGRLTRYVRQTNGNLKCFQAGRGLRVIAPDTVSPADCDPFLPFMRDPEPLPPIKAKHKRKVFYIQVKGEGFYLKKYSYRFTRRHFARLRGWAWTLPIAQRQLQKMLFLRCRGAAVVEPVLCMVRRYGVLKQESLLVMRECPGILLRRFLQEVDSYDRRFALVEQSFDFLDCLHANGIHHGDLTAHNFMVTPHDKLVAIDLDERKTKWLGTWIANRIERRRWERKCLSFLRLQGDAPGSPRRQAFARMLAAHDSR